ncbi:MAG: M48 family metalloprotease [Gammaproteobacteria bacterium]|jgi:predicted Zn-dependent protease|nr:M48 family metalloprotease [Gammaproteobacteria bacterium]
MEGTLPGLVLTAGLFSGGFIGDLLGGNGTDCRQSDARGARTMQTIVEEWPLRYAADPVRRYVRDLGTTLAQAADPSGAGLEWRFFVVRNLEPTAFAVGGRRFVISDGLIAYVRNESDLAAVLAHEIAHERLGHFCGDAQPGSARVHYGSIVQHFDLEMEKAADLEAVGLLAMAGFDPGSMYQVLRCLAERSDASSSNQLYQRMRALEVLGSGASAPNGRSSAEFQASRRSILEDLDTPIRSCR